MVNRELLIEKAVRGVSTGVGVLGSSWVGDQIAQRTSFGNVGIGATQAAIGYGVAVGSEMYLSGGRNGMGGPMIQDGVEHLGYGVHGAGFAEAAEALQTGARGDRVVRVNARGENSSNTQTQSEQNQETEDFNVELG